MKLVVVTSFLASSANCALSTMRNRERKMIRGDTTYEFGRTVDAIDIQAALQELKFMQSRFLIDGSILSAGSFPHPGMSFSYPGMSLPYPVMSLPYHHGSMSLGPLKPTWSSPNRSAGGDSSTPSPTIIFTPEVSPSIDASNRCISQDSSASTQIHVQLDVDSISNEVPSLDFLATNIVMFAEKHFSLCARSGDQRMLLEHVTSQGDVNVTVTGMDSTVMALDNSYDTCTPGDHNAFCTVVNLVLSVYSPSEESLLEAENQVYNEVLIQPLEAGTFAIGDIIDIRLHTKQNIPSDYTAVTSDGSKGASSNEPNALSTFRTAAICVLVLLAVGVMVGLVYRKRLSTHRESNRTDIDDDSKCERSTSDYIVPVQTLSNPHAV